MTRTPIEDMPRQLVASIRQNYKKYFLGGLFFIFILVLLRLVITYLTTGVVTINTDTGNVVRITKLGKTDTIVDTIGKTSKRLSSGSYALIVSSRLGGTGQLITVKARSHKTLSVNPADPLAPESVMPLDTSSIVVGAAQMYYINNSDNLLYGVDKTGVPKVVNADTELNKVIWRNISYGVAVSRDNETLYSVTDGTLSQINTPFASKTPVQFSFNNNTLVITDGKRAYKQIAGSSFSEVHLPKIDSSNPLANIESVGDSSFFVVQNKNSSGSDEEDAKYIIFDNNGVQTASLEVPTISYQWSPDNKYFALTSGGLTTIYTSLLKSDAVLPSSNTANASWLNNHVVLYSVGRDLMSYDLNTAQAIKLTSADSLITSITPTEDSSGVYVGSERRLSSDTTHSLQRINLSNKQAPAYAYTLGVFFPATTKTSCHLGYINFTQPIITMTGSTESACTASAIAELQQDQLPTAAFGLLYFPIGEHQE